jgi:hypothetical protein
MRTRFSSAMWAALATLALSSVSFAQIHPPSTEGHRSPDAVKAAANAPIPAYDPRDLTGVWWGRGNSILMGNPMPAFTPLGQKMVDANKPYGGPRAVAYIFTNDPINGCDPIGYPRIAYTNGRSFEFVQTPVKILQIFEWTHGMREIWLDGRKIPEDADPRWFGYAVGHWEGNTLVVESGAYNDKTWLDGIGDPHDENMTLVERYSHPDSLTLNLDSTLTDPTVYTKPWTGAKPEVYKLQQPKNITELEEEYCVPSEENSFNDHVRDVNGKYDPHAQ